jgi:hypothetical protein
MTKTVIYKYIGYNGSVTTPILLPNVDHLKMIRLKAADGHILTNGEKRAYIVTVLEESVPDWIEVKDITE